MTNEPFSDLCTIQLTLIGISFSIFTILYSLVLGKLDLLNNISNQIKQGNKSPELKQSEFFCLKYIRKLKGMNKWVIIVCSTSIFLLVLMSLIKHIAFPKWLYYTVCAANYLDFFLVLLIMILVFITYFKDSKFD